MWKYGAEYLCSFVLVVLGAVFLVSCTKPFHEENERYVFVATNIKLPYWRQAQAGFSDAASALGVKGELVGPAGYQPNAELTTFRQIVAEHPAGICLSAARPETFQADINEAVAQGIPVICVDADAANSNRIAYIGTDNLKAGRESLKQMATILPQGGNIVVVALTGQGNIDDRIAGVADALKNFPAIKLAHVIDDKGDAQIAQQQISASLQSKEKIDGIICLEATGGSGAAKAVHELKRDGNPPIVAFDDDPETLDWIERGTINATVAQKPYVMSYYGLRLLDDLRHNSVHQYKDWRNAPAAPLPTSVDTGTVVVKKENIKVYREALVSHTSSQ